MMTPLDPFILNLEKSTLIEASAGTGKTYTITTLYCRLVACGYPVESILVVTFTEAAAAELKLRIRARILNTLECLLENPCNGHDDLADFLSGQEEIALICQRLKLALICFDQTAIMTIHSFCFKILKENAFESQSLFDMALMPDRSLFLRQVSYDFFMGHVNNLDPLFLSFLNQRSITPERFAQSFGLIASRSTLVCSPSAVQFEDIFDPYRDLLKKIHDILLTRDTEIIELIRNHTGIDNRSYTRKNVPAWLETACRKLTHQGVASFFKMTEDGDSLYKFTQTRIRMKTKPGGIPPEHEFFDLCEQLLHYYHVFENNLISLKIEFLAFFNTELEKIKKTKGICFFDDLVNDLALSLETENGLTLQKAVRQTYKACLIDEFQDTDPRQYDVFSTFFSSPNTPFFMIGDPKQAIYAFRGGDIFAYLKASHDSEQKFTLEKNYRSAPLLVNAINHLFSSSGNPFLYEPIGFLKVHTPKTAINRLIEKNSVMPPLQFCFIQRADQPVDSQGVITKETAARIIPNACARDILGLLQSDMHLIKDDRDTGGGQKISPQDIAVLVRTNKQAEQIQERLSELNIPSYLSKTGSVFDSKQAMDLHDILWAVNHPDNKGHINAALCTAVFGFSSEKIIALDKEEALFFKWQDRFRAYKQIWETKGFVSMAMALLHSDETFLKKKQTGLDERGLTNFYHLIELISQACLKQHLSPYYLLKWYARQLFKDLRDESADELRLESDKKAVAIVTIHKSKGLEYPVVYLPYLWEDATSPSLENILFHDPEKGYALTLDLGSEHVETSRFYSDMENRAEQRRLLYVALTRASAMCRIIWGGFKSVETSALGTLLHPNGCKDDPSMIKDLEQLKSRAVQSILVQSYSHERPEPFKDSPDSVHPVLSARDLAREITVRWKTSSFSAITHSQTPEALPETEPSWGNMDGQPIITLAKFPKGARSGDLFHSIFETLDFTMDASGILKQVQSQCDLFGFPGHELVQMAETSVKQVLGTRLSTGASGFYLKDIHSDQRFNELEFMFSVPSFHLPSIQKMFEQADPKLKTSGYTRKISQLTAQSFTGFIKGFIDLVIHHGGKWYIIDYKSNYLGETYDQYSQDALFDAMSNHHYFLQYHLYLVALHRYLGLRLKNYDYDTHFGGVFYLFIRGMHPDFASQYGVFYDRPKKEMITGLSDKL